MGGLYAPAREGLSPGAGYPTRPLHQQQQPHTQTNSDPAQCALNLAALSADNWIAHFSPNAGTRPFPRA